MTERRDRTAAYWSHEECRWIGPDAPGADELRDLGLAPFVEGARPEG